MVSVRRYEPTFLAMLAGIASAKKSQRWPPLPDRERSSATGSASRPASLAQCPGIRLPGIAIKINRQQITGFVREQGIKAHDELPAQVIPARQVLANYVVGDRQEAPIWTFEALDAGLLAQAADPFVGASRLVATPASLSALEPTGINILAPAEQRAEQVDFGGGGRLIRDCAVRACRGVPCTSRGIFRRKCIRSHGFTLARTRWHVDTGKRPRQSRCSSILRRLLLWNYGLSSAAQTATIGPLRNTYGL